MPEVQILYGQDSLGHWSATITGAFKAQREGATRAEASRQVAAALAARGATYPVAGSDSGTATDSQTITYA